MISPRSITRASSRHPWATLAAWGLAIVSAIALSSALLADGLTTDVSFTNNPESKRADELIEARLRPEQDTEIVIVRSTTLSVDDEAFRAYVTTLQQQLAAEGPAVVTDVASYYDTNDETFVSADRGTTLVAVAMAGDDEVVHDNVPKIEAVLDARADPAFETLLFGTHSVGREFDSVAKEDLASGEMIGILAALVILLFVFGAVVAGVVPILMGLISIVISLGAVALFARATGFSFSFFVENMIAMMGLALGIDYSLFVISRYREERARGRDKLAAIECAGATAGRAVAFSGMTVVLALAGMLIVPLTIFRSLAGGAILVALASILASLTLLPALLAILGDRIDALRLRRRRTDARTTGKGVWERLAHGVMRHPVSSVVGASAVLLLAAAPFFSIRLGSPGVSTLPPDTRARQAFDVMTSEFAAGIITPIEITVDGDVGSPEVAGSIDELRAALARDGSFGPTSLTVNAAGDFAVVSAPPLGDPTTTASTDAVARIRDELVPAAFEGTTATVLVGGDSAAERDLEAMVEQYMPIVFAAVLGMSFLLLTVVFRSVVVALKAIVMNLLSVGAAYGLLVLVSQKGVGAGILGFQQVEAIAMWLPLFLFSVLFSLSMDYHVFLLTRIREHYDETGDNATSVAYGLSTTAGIITGAALIMVAVFAGFASGRLVAFQQMGFGLGIAVLVDATIIRCVLVPASMKLLGSWNWYLPRWLQWLPRVQVETGHGDDAGGDHTTFDSIVAQLRSDSDADELTRH